MVNPTIQNAGAPLILPEEKKKQNLEFWSSRYRRRSLNWHIEDVNPFLIKYLPMLTQRANDSSKNGKQLKFFLPLCGKTKDIPFLLSLGFQVFGVEGVDSVVQELIQENCLEMKYDQARSTYHTQDKQLQIYVGDFYKCPIEEFGPFDCIWDRAALVALNYPFRLPYLEVMKRAVAHGKENASDFRYLFHSVKYDLHKCTNPPHTTEFKDVQRYFGSWGEIECLESYITPKDHSLRKASHYPGDDFYEEFYMIKPKA